MRTRSISIVSLVICCAGNLGIPVLAQAPSASTAPAAAPAPVATVAPARTVVRPQRKQESAPARRHLRQSVPDQPSSNAGQPPSPVTQPQASPGTSPAVTNRRNRPRRDTAPPPTISYSQATQRQHHERHDRTWWKSRYTTIGFVTGCGHNYWDAGYWFPAWGYAPNIENFEYNGPIYTYGNLLPDQVIYNVQRALKELGYYSGSLNGSLGPATRAAISAFQEDNGLDVTGAIDAPTVEALGLY